MMKKILPLLAILLIAYGISAKPVNIDRAKNVANIFLKSKGISANLTNITNQTSFTKFYVFAIESGGFVIVSADDCVVPILGFSSTNNFGTRDIPENISWWLGQYENEIRYNADKYGDIKNDLWSSIEEGNVPTPLTTAVSPLLTTTWDQRPYYNDLCPYDSNENNYAVAGCVAIATAQIMKYWNWPTTGYSSHSYIENDYGTLSANFGTTTYDWLNMPNSISSVSSATQKTAVATLISHIGIADEMDYSVSGSGAHNYSYNGEVTTPCSQNSLIYYFKYRPDMRAVARDRYTTEEWNSMLIEELNESRPILYSGLRSSGGHSFVLDGYNNSGQFHVNWGWGGSSDGYFLIGNLNPSSAGTGANPENSYNESNVALIGIRPDSLWNSNTTVIVTAGAGGTATGAGTYSFLDTVTVTASANEGYRFMHWDDHGNFNPRKFLSTGGTYSFNAEFNHLEGDTLSYCYNDPMATSLGGWSGTKYWGIRLPASILTVSKYLNAAQLYVKDTGEYSMVIYSGTTSPSDTIAAMTAHFTSKGWKTVPLLTSYQHLDSTKSIWITFNSSASTYPAAMSYNSGNPDGMLWGTNFVSNYSSFLCTFMIRGIFGDEPDTIKLNTATCEILSFPYEQDFENNIECWDITDINGDGCTWEIGNDNGVNNSKCMQIRYATNATDNLASPYITIPGNYTLNWKAKIKSATYPETYSVLRVDDNSTTQLFSETLSSTNYANKTANFTVNPGDTVRLVFQYTSNDMWYLYIDEIEIAQNSALEQFTITATVSDPSMGIVTGGGTYYSGETAILSATPNNGYHFVQWNDGVTTPSRSITVNNNASYVATFEHDIVYYLVNVVSNDTSMGTVSGGGTYEDGTTISITATAKDGYQFIGWEDGNNANPRSITVSANVTYTAIFESIHDTTGISSIISGAIIVAPNPATDYVNVRGLTPGSILDFFDAKGCLLKAVVVGNENVTISITDLSAGIYYLRVGTSIKKLIVN